MKKIFGFSAFAAAAAVVLASCTKKDLVDTPVQEEAEPIRVTVVGDGRVEYDQTKTAAVELGAATYVKWLSTDKIDVWESAVNNNGSFAMIKSFTSETATNLSSIGGYGDIKADFPLTFTGTQTGANFYYTAVSPSGVITKTKNSSLCTEWCLPIPSTQTLSSDGNFAADSDVMIGQTIHQSARIKSGDVLPYTFTRPGTAVKLRLKGIHQDEIIQKITIDAPVNIAGPYKLNVTTGEVTAVSTIQSLNSLNQLVNVNASTQLVVDGNGFVSDGDDDVWLRVLAGTWPAGSSLSIRVDTDKATYTKSYENNLPREYVFAEGGLTKFGFSFGDSNRKARYVLVSNTSMLYPGAEYIMVGRYAGSSTATSNYYAVPIPISGVQTYFGVEKLDGAIGFPKTDPVLESVRFDKTKSNGVYFTLGMANGEYTFKNIRTDKYVAMTGTNMGEKVAIDDFCYFNITITQDYRSLVQSAKSGQTSYWGWKSATQFGSSSTPSTTYQTYLYVNPDTIPAN